VDFNALELNFVTEFYNGSLFYCTLIFSFFVRGFFVYGMIIKKGERFFLKKGLIGRLEIWYLVFVCIYHT